MDQLRELGQRIADAEYILLGGGAGLSASGGINYLDKAEFAASFPVLAARGIENRWAALWTRFEAEEEYWALWASHIMRVRHRAGVWRPYADLFSLVMDKKHFVISTNVDGQFAKAGFARELIFTPQGDYAYLQCLKPCRQRIFPNLELFTAMLAGLDAERFRIRSADIPRCPWCGGKVTLNLRSGANFVEGPWMAKSVSYGEFINAAREGELLLLELGVGFNTPGIIRYAFEGYTRRYPGAFLARLNLKDCSLPKDLAGKSLAVAGDIGENLIALAGG